MAEDQAFLTKEEADAFAEEYGGTVEAVGVAFVVHPKEAGQDASKDNRKSDSKSAK